MNKRRIISLIVASIVIIGFILGIIVMVTSKENRDNFVNTMKDIKNKPFMGVKKK